MDMSELEKLIKEIIAVADKIPEYYRLETYKVLLSKAILGVPRLAAAQEAAPETRRGETPKLEIPSKVRVFLKQHRIEESKVDDIFEVGAGGIEPSYEIDVTNKSLAQITIALLVAFENALRGGDFEFSLEEVRTRVIDRDAYVIDHFTHYFRRNKALFVTLDDPEHIRLSPEGKSTLAAIIPQLTGSSVNRGVQESNKKSS